jgi:hypothetical protein
VIPFGANCYGSPLGLGSLSPGAVEGAVAIYRLLQGQAFDPEAVECLTAAYEAALKLLRISNTDDPITETVAQRIIEIAQTGVRDPAKLCAAALKGFDVP